MPTKRYGVVMRDRVSIGTTSRNPFCGGADGLPPQECNATAPPSNWCLWI